MVDNHPPEAPHPQPNELRSKPDGNNNESGGVGRFLNRLASDLGKDTDGNARGKWRNTLNQMDTALGGIVQKKIIPAARDLMSRIITP